MKIYTFTVELSGRGDTLEEAWLDAAEAFAEDPGIAPENHTIEEEE